MKPTKEYLEDISEIRSIMERSSNFISLSGLSGVMAGLYALIGAYFANQILQSSGTGSISIGVHGYEQAKIIKLAIIAAIVLVLAVGTGIWLTMRKNGLEKFDFSDSGFRNLISSLSVPLVSGGLFILILVYRGFFSMVAPSFLIFYGLALINGSKYTVGDVRYLGLIEVILGLVCALIPGQGLAFWVIGFGLMHILYGTVMYFKYER